MKLEVKEIAKRPHETKSCVSIKMVHVPEHHAYAVLENSYCDTCSGACGLVRYDGEGAREKAGWMYRNWETSYG